jgi:hypothetical protein
MRIRAIPTGPEDPARVLAPALLSRSIAAFESTQAEEVARTLDQADFTMLLAIVFDICRTVFDNYEEGPVDIVQDNLGEYWIAIYSKFLLTADVSAGMVRNIYLSRQFLSTGKHTAVLSKWKELRHLIAASLEPHSISKSLIGNKAITKAASDILRNCPYYPASTVSSLHKWRYKAVNLVCTPETQQTVAELSLELKSRPRLLTVRGWCGGNVLHPCCRLGNVQQLRVLLDSISSREIQHKISIFPSDLIDGQNLDGCTPFYIARQYKQAEAAQVMLDAGADPAIPNRFGTLPTNSRNIREIAVEGS